jgi:hypothetical protein
MKERRRGFLQLLVGLGEFWRSLGEEERGKGNGRLCWMRLMVLKVEMRERSESERVRDPNGRARALWRIWGVSYVGVLSTVSVKLMKTMFDALSIVYDDLYTWLTSPWSTNTALDLTCFPQLPLEVLRLLWCMAAMEPSTR